MKYMCEVSNVYVEWSGVKSPIMREACRYTYDHMCINHSYHGLLCAVA